MLGQDFAETGWHIVVKGGPIRRYQVFGERSSGTNFVKRLIGRNSPLQPIEELGWKHALPHMTAIPEDTAIVCVVRDARPWALSMHAKPWHCPPEMQALGFSDFIRAEWGTVADRRRYFPQVAQLGGEGQPLQLDRDPLSGKPYENLFALRRAKISGLFSFLARDCTLIFVRLESVLARQEEFLDTLHTAFDLSARSVPLRPVVKRLGAKFVPAIENRPATPATLATSDLAFLKSQIDTEQELLLGYSYT